MEKQPPKKYAIQALNRSPENWQFLDQCNALRVHQRRKLFSKVNEYPHFLYHYLPANHLDRLSQRLLESEFWLSSPSDFNDPFDMTAKIAEEKDPLVKRRKLKELAKQFEPSIKGVKREKLVTKLMTDPRFTEEMIRENVAYNMNRTGVFCLSENPRNILMWGHYAQKHTGLVLQFEVARDLSVLTDAFSVMYNEHNKFPTYNFFSEDTTQLRNVVLTKHKEWVYEKERRIICQESAHTYLRMKPEALTGIIFGCNASDKFKQEVLEIIKQRIAKGLPSIKLYQAEKHGSAYELRIEKSTLACSTSKYKTK